MSGFEVIVDPSTDLVTIKTDDGELNFKGKHRIAALSAQIDKAIVCLFGENVDDTKEGQGDG